MRRTYVPGPIEPMSHDEREGRDASRGLGYGFLFVGIIYGVGVIGFVVAAVVQAAAR